MCYNLLKKRSEKMNKCYKGIDEQIKYLETKKKNHCFTR